MEISQKRKALTLFLTENLTNKNPLPNTEFISAFRAALRDARHVTNRDHQGNKLQGEQHDNWLGALGYMALLDQIGTCFKPTSCESTAGNSLQKSLRYFSDKLNDAEINAIFALRCAFAHDFSLVNVNHKIPEKTHCFHISPLYDGSVVKLPPKRWNGCYDNVNDSTATTVDIVAFGDLVEEICQDLIELAKKDELEIVLDGTHDELISRYTFTKERPH